MATHDRDRTHNRDDFNDRVDVAPGVPTDRVRWGPILAGTFAALTALAVLATLGAAIGLSSYDRGQDDPRNFAMAGGAWGIISTILAFAFGGWVAARSAAVRGRDNGLLNGAMVAGFGIPLMLLFFSGAGLAMTHAEVANNRDAQARGQYDGAITASARMSGNATGGATTGDNPTGMSSNNSNGSNGNNQPADDREAARRAGSRTAWSMLTAMVLAIAAAAAAGYVGARDDRRDWDRHDDRRDYTRGGNDAGGTGTAGGQGTGTTASTM